ncbi:glucan 1,3-beta-glucosidase a [Fusarium sporotrichioides]|uniref:glucan 1,3-beta-glucosidase n=1 Tax=Fusarium sporotrichioides TaxID=5514 RepID=A0A395S2Y2_FUSSP|nr:glucan 1,3-beta-glucosidase a [Fusarium sporotrichioides]
MKSSAIHVILAVVLGLANAAPSSNYIDWKTFKANGVNLGGWLHQEAVIDPKWWNQYAPGTPDEWDFCAQLGSRCGPVLEQRYNSYITTKDVDVLAAAGINVLRIPTGYNAWVDVPGSQLYTGGQARFLRAISDYAIKKHGIHIILDIHSLPGGLNGMGLGEKEGNYGWFQNQTALDYSLKAVDAAIKFIQQSDYPQGFTLAPINEPVDNRDITKFGTPDALSDKGAAWVMSYFKDVVSRVQKANPRIPIMLQGGFRPVEFWAESFTSDTNIVFDVHHYYFAGRPSTSNNLPELICSDAQATVGTKKPKFPIFVGEWSIQAASANTFTSRARNLNTGLKTWSTFTQGSAYWTYKFFGDAPVDGEGTQGDYWNYSDFIEWGIINPVSGVACK